MLKTQTGLICYSCWEVAWLWGYWASLITESYIDVQGHILFLYLPGGEFFLKIYVIEEGNQGKGGKKRGTYIIMRDLFNRKLVKRKTKKKTYKWGKSQRKGSKQSIWILNWRAFWEGSQRQKARDGGRESEAIEQFSPLLFSTFIFLSFNPSLTYIL